MLQAPEEKNSNKIKLSLVIFIFTFSKKTDTELKGSFGEINIQSIYIGIWLGGSSSSCDVGKCVFSHSSPTHDWSGAITWWLILTLNHQLMVKMSLSGRQIVSTRTLAPHCTQCLYSCHMMWFISFSFSAHTHQQLTCNPALFSWIPITYSSIICLGALSSHLWLDSSAQWNHQYPSSSFYIAISFDNVPVCPIIGSSWNWQRALQHTQSCVISLSCFFLILFTLFLPLLIWLLVFHLDLLTGAQHWRSLIFLHCHHAVLPCLSTLACLLSFHPHFYYFCLLISWGWTDGSYPLSFSGSLLFSYWQWGALWQFPQLCEILLFTLTLLFCDAPSESVDGRRGEAHGRV